jgi:uncharacterized protein (TIGR02266 family)
MSAWRILVADDEPLVRQIMQDILEALPATVLTARDGEEALSVAKAERPDLILLDVMMPKLDGFGVAEALKRDASTAAIPLIFISALGASRDKVRGLNLGAEDYLAKPIDPEQLRGRVRTILGRVRPPEEEEVPTPAQTQAAARAPVEAELRPPTPAQPAVTTPAQPSVPAVAPRATAPARAPGPVEAPTQEPAVSGVPEPAQATGHLASGLLQAMNLESLVQLLEAERQTARLLLARGAERGEIAFVDGAITRAVQAGRLGEAAVYQLLTWREGTFHLGLPEGSSEVGGPITKPNQALLLEGMRRLDEIPGLRAGLPDPTVPLEVSAELRGAVQKEAKPDAATLMALLDGTRTQEQVLAQSPFDDWTTLRDLYYLFRTRAMASKDVLRERRSGPRVLFQLPIEYQMVPPYQQAPACNLSARGVFIQTATPFEMGEQVLLRFTLPGQETPVKVMGQVVSRNLDPSKPGGEGMGIRFMDLPVADRELIERNLTEVIAEELSRMAERRART